MASVTDKTLEIIHREYNVAVGTASSMQEIPEIMHRNLKALKADIPEEDSSVFFSFMDGLVNCYRERKNDVRNNRLCNRAELCRYVHHKMA